MEDVASLNKASTVLLLKQMLQEARARSHGGAGRKTRVELGGVAP